jgi:hypothetical protein
MSGIRFNSADGSQATQIQSTSRIFGLFVQESHIGRTIYTRNPRMTYVVDDEERTAVAIPCTCEWERRPWPQDAQCSAAANLHDSDLVYAEWSRVAGIPVTRYRRVTSSDFTEVAFAPSIHCEVMDELSIVFGIGKEKSYSHFTVTKFIPGEPDPSVFRPPWKYETHTFR